MGARRTEEGEAGLLVARDRAGVDAEPLAQLLAKCIAVGRVPHGAGREGDDRLRLKLVDRGAVLGDGVEHPLDRTVGEAAARVDAFAEPGDGGAPVELADATLLHLADEQTGGVRAEVDDRDAQGAASYGPLVFAPCPTRCSAG